MIVSYHTETTLDLILSVCNFCSKQHHRKRAASIFEAFAHSWLFIASIYPWKEISSGGDYLIITSTDGRTTRLSIENVTSEHSGTYEVQATSSSGVASSQTHITIDSDAYIHTTDTAPVPTEATHNGMDVDMSTAQTTIIVEEGQSPPVFRIHPQGQHVEEDNSVVLEFNVDGNPIPEVQWSFNDGEILAGHQFNQENDHVRLELFSLTPEDTGSYECVATNALGKARTVAHLIVNSESAHFRYHMLDGLWLYVIRSMSNVPPR